MARHEKTKAENAPFFYPTNPWCREACPVTIAGMTERGNHESAVEAQLRGENMHHAPLLTSVFAAFGLLGIFTDDFGVAVVGTGLAFAFPIAVYFEHKHRRSKASARDEAERIARERRLEELSR